MKGELVAALILADISPPATAPGLKRLECHGEPSWSQPLDVQLWIGKCLKHQLARRVEFARDEHFLFPWFCDNGCFVLVCHFSFFPFKPNCLAWPITYAHHPGLVRLCAYQLQVDSVG